MPFQDRSPGRHTPEKSRVTLVGLAINLPLSAAKIVLGMVGQSQALVADGLHSLSDSVSDVAILLALRIAGRDADHNHPYGHARFETLAAGLIGVLLMAVAIGVVSQAAGRLMSDSGPGAPAALALVAALASLLLKEGLYHYTIRSARRLNSALMRANAWHHRSDALSSLIALLGIGGAMAGAPWLDPLAAAVIAAILFRMGWKAAWPALQDLLDTGLSDDRVESLYRQIAAVPDVREVTALRTRRSGDLVLLDATITVDPRLSVSDGHRIAEAVRQQLAATVGDVADATIHVEPDEPTPEPALHDLPGRSQTLADLHRCWGALVPEEALQRVTLHYVNGAIEVELLLPIDLADAMEHGQALEPRLRHTAAALPYIRSVAVHFG